MEKKNTPRIAVTKILISFLFSVLFIWGCGYFFCDSLIYHQYDDELEKLIQSPDSVHKNRSEGFSKTYKGLYGVNAIKDISADARKKFIVWGDSYIEAHQVNDHEKIPQIVTAKFADMGFAEQLMCFGVGMSGDSVADYYFDMPKYERLTQQVVSHYIVFTQIEDTLPDQPGDINKGLFRSNPLRIYHEQWKPKFQNIKRILNKYKLYFLWNPVKSTMASVKKLRFNPMQKKGRRRPDSNKKAYSNKQLTDAWHFLFKELQQQTQTPIVFVYCPYLPKIQNGNILTEDKSADQIALFTQTAGKYNIPVLNLSQAFNEFYQKTGVFPRGFSNTKPSLGHFNKYGHELVSEVITAHIKTQTAR